MISLKFIINLIGHDNERRDAVFFSLISVNNYSHKLNKTTYNNNYYIFILLA